MGFLILKINHVFASVLVDIVFPNRRLGMLQGGIIAQFTTFGMIGPQLETKLENLGCSPII